MTTIHSNSPMKVGELIVIQEEYDMKYYEVVKCRKQSTKWISHPAFPLKTGLYHITLKLIGC